MMRSYVCQIFSNSGRVLETFFEDYFDAVIKCMNASHCQETQVFKYPNMKEPICAARTIK